MHPSRNNFQLGSSTYWQTAFIHDHFPVLGYYAWVGFERVGWGMVACQIELPDDGFQPGFHRWNFTLQFVPASLLATYLQDVDIASDEIPELVAAIAQYNPQREMMLLLHWGQTVEVNWLKNMAMSPQECYKQVCDRWEEFMPGTLFKELSVFIE